MGKYTKGNWHIIGKSEMDGIEIGINNKDGTKCPLATVNWYGEDDCNAEQDEATALLITAAPDLLEASKFLIENLDRALTVLSKEKNQDFHNLRTSEACQKIEAAIAKAEKS